jgi:TRAP transporter 4TM/12TM fusion protein
MFDNWVKKVVFLLCLSMAIFGLYASFTQAFEAYLHRTIFLGFTLILVFLTKPAIKSRPRLSFWLFDLPMVIFCLIPVLYGIAEHYSLLMRGGESTQYDFIFGTILIILVLEATRRAVGWPMLILAMILIIYAMYGPYFPRAIAHAGYSLRELVEVNYMGVDGIFGVTLGVVVDFVFLFIIFGALLGACGGVKRFTNIAVSIMGWQTGGPAKTAVLASGIMGSLSGSAAANVVTTGSFTIPMMKSLGYKPTFAGAVEAAASSGGQIMPPVMGASAFVIASILGMTYLGVCRAALLPAIFYFLSVWICVHYYSKKIGLKGLARKELPPILPALMEGGLLLTPVIVIIAILMYGYSPIPAGFWAIVTLLGASSIRKGTRLNFKRFVCALGDGSKDIISIAIVCACAGIIISCFLITGLGMRISTIVASIAVSNVYLALMVAAIACLILGMGMPTIGAYIIVATLGAPAIINMGFPKINTHLFVFFFAMLSNVTPPVALAAYAASPIAGEGTNPWKIGWMAFSFTLASFILPFIFITNSALILEGSMGAIIYSIIVTCIAILSLNVGIVGYLSRKLSLVERILFMISSILLYKPDIPTDMVGFVLFFFLLLFQKKEVVSRTRKLSHFLTGWRRS